MANVQLSERAEHLYAKRREACDEYFLSYPVVRYTDTTEPRQFLDYFYPWERLLVQSNNFENYEARTKRTDDFFAGESDLNAFEADLPTSSSNDEDRPPASEELFFDQKDDGIFDELAKTTRYAPLLTKMQRNLLRTIARYVFDAGDNMSMVTFKREARLKLLRGYLKDLKRKRFARAYRRYRNTRAKKLDLGKEALDLLEMEILQKHLNRSHYYDQNEPPEYKKLLSLRRNAIKMKFLQYLTDPKYRRAYRDRIYFNVNMDVPDKDTRHMQSTKLLLADANQALNPYAEIDVAALKVSNVLSWTQQRKCGPKLSAVDVSISKESPACAAMQDTAHDSEMATRLLDFPSNSPSAIFDKGESIAAIAAPAEHSMEKKSEMQFESIAAPAEHSMEKKSEMQFESIAAPAEHSMEKISEMQFESMKEQMARQTPAQKAADDAAFDRRAPVGHVGRRTSVTTTEPNRLPPLLVQPGLFTWAIRNVVRKAEAVSRMQLAKGGHSKTGATTKEVIPTSNVYNEHAAVVETTEVKDTTNENVSKEGVVKEEVLKEDLMKEDFVKQDIVNEDVVKVDLPKVDVPKEDVPKEEAVNPMTTVCDDEKATGDGGGTKDLNQRQEDILQKESSIKMRENEIQKLESELKEKEVSVREKEADLEKKEAALS